jgi:hypothetical protein
VTEQRTKVDQVLHSRGGAKSGKLSSRTFSASGKMRCDVLNYQTFVTRPISEMLSIAVRNLTNYEDRVVRNVTPCSLVVTSVSEVSAASVFRLEEKSSGAEEVLP